MSSRAVSVFALLAVLSAIATAAESKVSVVRVSGQGSVQVVPDQVGIDISVTTTDDDLIRVRESSDDDARKILTLANKHGVADDGFKVDSLRLTFSYNEQLRRRIYQVHRNVNLRLNDLGKLDGLLSDLLDESNLQILGIHFVTSQTRQHEFEARKRAVSDAKEKATQLAELNGLKLGDALQIDVVSESYVPFASSVAPSAAAAAPRRRGVDRGEPPLVAQADSRRPHSRFAAFQEKVESNGGGKEPFALGMIEITAHVSIEFELTK
ncbi:MAG: SIMPL domain-containing protein [Pirellulaceae bacterium]